MTGTAVRESDGTFRKGVSGNPTGLPKGTVQRVKKLQLQLEEAVRENINAQDVGDIVAKLVSMAKDGNIKAAKLILDKTIANATPTTEEQGDKQSVVIFRIENATFGAKQAPEDKTGEAIEAEFTASDTPTDIRQDQDGN